MLNKLDFQGARYTVAGDVPKQEGNYHPTQVPMGTFHSKDGMVNIAASTVRMWPSFCNALGATELLEHSDYKTPQDRLKNRVVLNAAVNELTKKFSTDELIERLNPAGVPCGPVYDIQQAFEDPQTKHLRMTRPATHPVLGEVNLVRSPINLSSFPFPDRFHLAAPDPGEQSDGLLSELGLSQSDIESLKGKGVVA